MRFSLDSALMQASTLCYVSNNVPVVLKLLKSTPEQQALIVGTTPIVNVGMVFAALAWMLEAMERSGEASALGVFLMFAVQWPLMNLVAGFTFMHEKRPATRTQMLLVTVGCSATVSVGAAASFFGKSYVTAGVATGLGLMNRAARLKDLVKFLFTGTARGNFVAGHLLLWSIGCFCSTFWAVRVGAPWYFILSKGTEIVLVVLQTTALCTARARDNRDRGREDECCFVLKRRLSDKGFARLASLDDADRDALHGVDTDVESAVYAPAALSAAAVSALPPAAVSALQAKKLALFDPGAADAAEKAEKALKALELLSAAAEASRVASLLASHDDLEASGDTLPLPDRVSRSSSAPKSLARAFEPPDAL
ncbi:hypothetical protein M885DRAFT_515298 [Pelagophyceae sp. CCMP2097]|nr:hypothetical protein M885DRAFT_515298 [Pelagophyceae sp. CCMP2097]